MSSLAASEWLAMQLSTPQDGVMSPDTPLAMFFTVTWSQEVQLLACSLNMEIELAAPHGMVLCLPTLR